MQLSVSFSYLLTTLLFALAQVEAIPTKRSPGTVTLPLKRLPQPSDVHPSILFQQHINRSHRRHAQMRGLQGPSDAELAKRLQKRLDLVESQKFDKRYNRIGLDKISPSSHSDGRVLEEAKNEKAAPGQGFPEVGLGANGLTQANGPTAADSLGLAIDGYDTGYVATVQVGTPPRDYAILMDSGSADFWIGGEGCKGDNGGDCGSHNYLGSQTSSTFKDSGKTWQIQYGSGQLQGNTVSDNVNIAGLALNNLAFGTALVESSDFTGADFDGLLGLAKSSLSNQGVLTPVESLAQQGLISEPITSYKISRLSDGLNDGEITFGGLDSSKFDSGTLVTFNNVNTDGFWEGALTVSVNGDDLGLNGRTGILDTGTTLIYAPAADAQALHAKIPGSKDDGQNGYTIPCTTTAVVSLTFGGKTFDINPLDLLVSPVDQNNLQGDCYSGIISGTTGGANEWLVGDVFLKNVYFSHNVKTNEISLAKLV